MNKKIYLSYSTLYNYHQASHTYVNKMLGIETPTNEYMEKGKEAHKKLQDHLIGKKKLSIDLKWNITTAEYHCRKPIDQEFVFHGYLDGVNFKSKLGVEIKTGTPWSANKFYSSIQPKYYSWVTGLKKFLFITCKFDLTHLRVYYEEDMDQYWKEAEEWAMKAYTGIKAGEFDGGLDENKKCQGCNYRENCHFL